MGVSPGCASSAITAWAIWSDFIKEEKHIVTDTFLSYCLHMY